MYLHLIETVNKTKLQKKQTMNIFATLKINFTQVLKENYKDVLEHPEHGCYIRGLFLEGARWDHDAMMLTDCRPKELYTDMAVMWLVPQGNRFEIFVKL